jgi:hypothetical protein
MKKSVKEDQQKKIHILQIVKEENNRQIKFFFPFVHNNSEFCCFNSSRRFDLYNVIFLLNNMRKYKKGKRRNEYD